jgi:hypothetical protein
MPRQKNYQTLDQDIIAEIKKAARLTAKSRILPGGGGLPPIHPFWDAVHDYASVVVDIALNPAGREGFRRIYAARTKVVTAGNNIIDLTPDSRTFAQIEATIKANVKTRKAQWEGAARAGYFE